MLGSIEDLRGDEQCFQVPRASVTEGLVVPKALLHGCGQSHLNVLAHLCIVMVAQAGEAGQTDAWRTMAPGDGKFPFPVLQEACPVALLWRKKAALVGQGRQRPPAESVLLACLRKLEEAQGNARRTMRKTGVGDLLSERIPTEPSTKRVGMSKQVFATTDGGLQRAADGASACKARRQVSRQADPAMMSNWVSCSINGSISSAKACARCSKE